MAKKRKHTDKDYIKANRHGEWLANNENSTGWISIHKVHPTKKSYKRNTKYNELSE